jgi:hypothetical protein
MSNRPSNVIYPKPIPIFPLHPSPVLENDNPTFVVAQAKNLGLLLE